MKNDEDIFSVSLNQDLTEIDLMSTIHAFTSSSLFIDQDLLV